VKHKLILMWHEGCAVVILTIHGGEGSEQEVLQVLGVICNASLPLDMKSRHVGWQASWHITTLKSSSFNLRKMTATRDGPLAVKMGGKNK
jgi:hypothetical protein